MKTVFDGRQCAHVWAQQTQPEGRNSGGSIFFEGPTIYSYGTHFPMARFVTHKGRRAVLVTTRRYSVTTSKHQSYVWHALRGLDVPQFNVADPTCTHHPDVRRNYEARLAALTATAIRAVSRKTSRAESYMADARDLANEANRYAEFFGLRWRIKVPEFTPEAIAAAKDQAAKAAARKAKADKARKLKAEREAAKRLAEWRAGAHNGYLVDAEGYAYLRVNGRTVQTSRGVTVPRTDALRAGRLIAACRTAGRAWQANGETMPVGEFHVDRIEPTGDIVAGCHRIRWAEIEPTLAALEAAGIE